MVPFAGYAMPVQYPTGILAEHLWTREHAGLFDVSHMGQAALIGPDHATTARALEALVPADILNLKPGQQRYTQLLDDERRHPRRPDGDAARRSAPGRRAVSWSSTPREGGRLRPHRGAAAGRRRASPPTTARSSPCRGRRPRPCSARHAPDVASLAFMRRRTTMIGGIDGPRLALRLYRRGRLRDLGAGEPRSRAVARSSDGRAVKPIGLGARDSLRLEAGLCLYGHDIDDDDLAGRGGPDLVDPEAPPRGGRLPGRRAHPARAAGTARRACASASSPRAARRPARAPSIATPDGAQIGMVTSGGFGPSVNGPVAMGYVARGVRRRRARSCISIVRGKPLPAQVVPMPFVPHRYKQSRVRDADDHALHQGPRIDPRRRRHRHRRHHRLRPEPARRRRLRRAAGASAKASPRAARRRSSRASRRRARSTRRSPAR